MKTEKGSMLRRKSFKRNTVRFGWSWRKPRGQRQENQEAVCRIA